ncbi:MAG TPA: hypothetical protein VN828_10600 [Acidobacteriaceae bacterium]|nr:hypothetical protein [Acidobacteriaceae bacterium]
MSLPALLRISLLLLLVPSLKAQAPVYVNAQVAFHPAVLDGHGNLLAWYQPEKNLGYDHVLRLGWNFIEHKVPVDTRHHTGLKIYLINSVMDGDTLQGEYWQHNPAMVYAAFVDGVVGWYPYSGDDEAITAVGGMLDYQLAHGTTPSDWEWPNVPFATSCDDQTDYGHCIQNMPKEFYGGIETDKVGQLGAGYTLFYELTGDKKYLTAAQHCADALARHVRAGDEEHTPWPFRLDARTGVTLAQEEYGGDVSSSVRMFDELIRLKAGDTAAYQRARDVAWTWVLKNPLNRSSKAWDKWAGFFEDVPYLSDNVNQFLPDLTAYYIMSRPDPAAVDPEWVTHVGHMIDWVRLRFGRGPFLGAWAIDEQGPLNGRGGCCSRAGQGSHGGRWAAINAMYAERTGDGQARRDAFRSMNYATYFTSSEGLVACCGQDYHAPYWFSDGYADYLRHFNWTMGALPELAPVGESHLLRSSTVVQKVKYEPKRISYKTFDADGTEVLRLNFKPVRVTAGQTALTERKDLNAPGYTLEPVQSDFIVRLRHTDSPEIALEGGK